MSIESDTQRTPEDALSYLEQIAPNLMSRGTFVVTQQGRDEPDLFRLSVTEGLRNEFLNTDIGNIGTFVNKTPIQYMPWRNPPDGHIMWAPATDVTLLSTLATESDANRIVPTLDVKRLAAHNLKMTITTDSPQGGSTEHVTFYRITRNTARLAQAGRIAAIVRGNAFDYLDDEVILFNLEVDAITFDGYVFFRKKGLFERAFGFVEALKRQARHTFEQVIAVLNIDGMEDLRSAATTDINMVAKMASIKRKLDEHPSYKEAMTMPKLLAFIDANPQIDVETSGSGDNRALVFRRAPASRFKILKLLDDDFLTSNLTDFYYMVDSKGDPVEK